MSRATPPHIDTTRLREELRRIRADERAGFGWEIHHETRVSSTQEILSRLENSGAPEGCVVIAEEQTGGRGRYGRGWHSAPGLGLYMSVLFRPQGRTRPPGLHALVGAIAVCEAVRRTTDPPAEIKWPNDVLLDGRKVAGILVEARSVGENLRGVGVGIGVNVAHALADFPSEISGSATSLAIAAGHPPDRTVLCATILSRLAHWVASAGPGGAEALDRFRELSPSCRGRSVTIDSGSGPWDGVTAGIDGEGGLRVRRSDGQILTLRHNEEVRVREVI